MMLRFVAILLATACGASPEMRLSHVVLYQNGVAYFERSGRADGPVHIRVAAHEMDDVITTLTVVDPERPDRSPTPSAVVPRERGESGSSQELAIDLGGGSRDVVLAYAAPTSAWRASYRLVLPDERGARDAWLQAWAIVDNTSAEDWRDVELTLATDAPLSFAVDLRTPRMVERPNVTGYTTPRIALGPIRAEQTTRGEIVNGLEDPHVDVDHDGIADVDDRCPDDLETLNGMADEDGCPDMGRVMISSNEVRITSLVYFDTNRIEPLHSAPIAEIANVLRDHPELTRVEVRGHAERSEEDPWRLSAERAARVRAELIELGIAPERLIARAFGDAQPIGGARDRRVELHFSEQSAPRTQGPVERRAIERSGRGTPMPQRSGGGTRFSVGRPVSIPAGDSAMVTILNRSTTGEDVLLFRVDPNAPESTRHPFRAARLENRSGIDLVPGPLSLFARGELVGQGLIDTLAAGENAFVPYAIDRSTHVASEVSERETPGRISGISRGVVALERIRVRATQYRIEAGHRVPQRIFVRHLRSAGFEPLALPPETETSPDAILAPIPIEGGRDAQVSIEEQTTLRASIHLADDLTSDLRPYLAGSELSAAERAAVESLQGDRDALARSVEQTELLRVRLSESAARAEELRRTMRALDERAGRSAAPVRRRTSERLDEALREADELAERLSIERAEQSEARARLRAAAQELEIPARPASDH
jgi:outer membrane protein OmpA-like peptidoglycan-associated protein